MASKIEREIEIIDIICKNNNKESLLYISGQIGFVEQMAHKSFSLSSILLAINGVVLSNKIPGINISSLNNSNTVKGAIFIGFFLIILATITHGMEVYRVKWVTTPANLTDDITDNDLFEQKKQAIDIRNEKLKGYHRGLKFLLFGLLSFVVAFILIFFSN